MFRGCIKIIHLSEDAEKVMSAKSVTGRSAWTRYFDETLGAARFEFDGRS
jgi:oligoendopeptidase F